MSALFVAGTGTDVGKTHVACALIRALKARGLAVDAFKPVVSGFDPADPSGSDPARLAEALGDPAALPRISPRRYRAPLAPNLAARLEGDVLRIDDLAADCRAALAGAHDLLLVEGAGGVMSPLTDQATNLDLIAALDLPVLLIAGSYLGTISHVLTALIALRARGVRIAAIVMSESLDAPDLVQTADALRAFERETPIFLAPRDEAWDAGELADHLAKGF
ncbi:dethiobiotin synthase [Caulobacter flavus]|uniref:ATP-dependent dethiobiotin synthetase BioD n=1 Tax=Caulobacter flavus TaxID=1679497 RepID=A0A2N5CLE1_9CAUL|nr:dethiobiotin synthase [Caulobacter flavus]AYV48396.1 dethiobiotin synthase [Caulobacter flavus]PLR06556.1 dethiobiotin synthase [Caulobacter flavus]